MALATRDPALYAELAAVLRERRIPTVSVLPGDRIPDRAAVVLTSPAETSAIQHPRVLGVPADSHPESLIAAIAGALGPASNSDELIVGIDPGPRPGFAVLAGGNYLLDGTLSGPEESAELGRNLHRRFPDRSIRFRVGSGDRTSRTRIVNALWELRRPVELVDEAGTTPRGHRRPRDAIAARHIARAQGQRVEGPAPLQITPGEVANVQRLSRESSEGRFTISKELAARVLEGELTLAQAVEEGERRYRAPAVPASRGARQRS
ncbi:MAG TPA: hypothetical protein VGV89_05395 [Thermoplasmata archaeon]|nr:hypothetical protein [Thermoplasmata archaeon]